MFLRDSDNFELFLDILLKQKQDLEFSLHQFHKSPEKKFYLTFLVPLFLYILNNFTIICVLAMKRTRITFYSNNNKKGFQITTLKDREYKFF